MDPGVKERRLTHGVLDARFRDALLVGWYRRRILGDILASSPVLRQCPHRMRVRKNY